jgi:hypothetical protein
VVAGAEMSRQTREASTGAGIARQAGWVAGEVAVAEARRSGSAGKAAAAHGSGLVGEARLRPVRGDAGSYVHDLHS